MYLVYVGYKHVYFLPQHLFDIFSYFIYFACGVMKNADTHSEYVILTVSPQQQSLHELASMLCAALLRQIVTRSVVL